MASTVTKKSTKGIVVITYLIAFAVLIGGFFIPLFGLQLFGKLEMGDRMLFKYLPGVLNSALGKEIIPLDKMSWALPFYDSGVNFFGVNVKIESWCILIYAVMAVLSVLCLLPVLFGKKTTRTSAFFAYIPEAVTVAALTVYFVHSGMFSLSMKSWDDLGIFSLLIVYGVVLIMLIVQSIANKGKMGTAKMLIVILGILCLTTLYEATVIIPNSKDMITKFANLLNTYYGFDEVTEVTLAAALGYGEGTIGMGIFGYMMFMRLDVYIKTISGFNTNMMIYTYALIAAATLCIINLVLDTLFLATGSYYKKNGLRKLNACGKLFAFVRYALQFIAAITLVVMTIVMKTSIYLYLYLFTVFTIILFTIALVRVILMYRLKIKIKKEKEQKEKEERGEIVTETEDDDYTEDVYEPTPAVFAVPETNSNKRDDVFEVSEEEQVEDNSLVYNYNLKAVYSGPLDEFLKTLNDAEKIEFVKIFIEKIKGEFKRIPDYEIGGENAQFFTMVFVYIYKFRQMLTENLIAKMYKWHNTHDY